GLLGFLANADQMAAELNDTRADFLVLMALLVEHPQGIWTSAELVALAEKHKLFANGLGEGSPHSRATCMGRIAGSFIDERYVVGDKVARFRRNSNTRCTKYWVEILPENSESRADV